MPINPGVDNLVSWWPLDEVSGTRYDAHGSNDLTDNATVTSGTGVQGNAADFETSNSEYLSLAAGSALHFGDVDWTWVVWVNFESFPSNPGIVGADNNTTVAGYRLDYFSGAFRAFLMNSGVKGNAVTTETISLSTWYMVAFWHDAASNVLGVQIGGQSPHTVSTTGAGVASGFSMTLGARSASVGPFDGLIDEAAAWNRVLTADEIAWLYNSGAGRTYAELSGGSALPIIMQAHAAAGWR